MNGEELSSFYSDKSNNYHSRTDILKLLLMPLVFVTLIGFPGKVGGYLSTYSNFVPQVFFILFGFFTLVPDKYERNEKLKAALLRALKLFLIMLVCYILLNIVYFKYMDAMEFFSSPYFLRKKTFFNFLVLNVWPLPVGNSIWFIQSLVYAYIFFIVAEKIKLSKFYLPIFIVLVIFMLATGEFAAFLGFPYYGYAYIPGGAVTRAIPYMLIGMYIRKNVDKLSKIPQYAYPALFAFGLLAAVAEIVLLNRAGKLVYIGHTIGFGLMAFAVCCFGLSKPKSYNNYIVRHSASYARRMYALCQPVSFLLWLAVTVINPAFLGISSTFGCLISFVISFIVAFVVSLMRKKIYK